MSTVAAPVPFRSALKRPSMWLALVLLAFGVFELLSLWCRVRAVPTQDEWQQAAAFVRSELRPTDQIHVAPRWISAHVRRELGDVITPEMIGASDDAAFDRAWLISIRGQEKDGAAQTRSFGRVTVQRFDRVGDSASVQAHLVKLVDQAHVTLGDRVCEHRSFGGTRGGGLGTGPVAPGERFVCDPRNDGLWVGRTLNEDLALEPRDCVYQPAQGREPLRVTFDDVALGDSLVFYGGLYSEAERMEDHAPIDVVVRSGDREIGRFTHRDGEGWTRHQWPTGGGRGPLSVEVASENGDRRMFCWNAYTRIGASR